MKKSKENKKKKNNIMEKNDIKKKNDIMEKNDIKKKNDIEMTNDKKSIDNDKHKDTKLTLFLKLLLVFCVFAFIGMIIFDIHSAHIVNDSLTGVTTELDRIISENQSANSQEENIEENNIDTNDGNEENVENNENVISTPKKMSVNIGNSKVFGKIKIKKIDIEYPIIEYLDDNSLWKSICKISNNSVNGTGNLCLAGHNMRNLTMFAKIKWLEVGDEVEITNIYGEKYKYIVYDKFYVDPTNVDVMKNTAEPIVTMITCNNSSSKRLIVKARLQ